MPVDDGGDAERKEIEKWFALGNWTSPLTGEELPSTNLLPNITLRNVIRESGLLSHCFDRDDGTQGWKCSWSRLLQRRPYICTVRHEIETALIESVVDFQDGQNRYHITALF